MTSTTTLASAIDRFAVEVDEHLDRSVEIPVLTGPQRQGDIIILPRNVPVAKTAVPPAGVAVVRGENGGNTHLLLADGKVFYDPRQASADDLWLGTLTVADDATAYLAHPEHGYMGHGPGTYEILRQREQADQLRLVAD
jgi:hypothetical protein